MPTEATRMQAIRAKVEAGSAAAAVAEEVTESAGLPPENQD